MYSNLIHKIEERVRKKNVDQTKFNTFIAHEQSLQTCNQHHWPSDISYSRTQSSASEFVSRSRQT